MNGAVRSGFLREAGPARNSLQAHVQPLYGAVDGDFPLAPWLCVHAILLPCDLVGVLSCADLVAVGAGLNKWVEIGNSGMFRPEMLRPMGFPEVKTRISALALREAGG